MGVLVTEQRFDEARIELRVLPFEEAARDVARIAAKTREHVANEQWDVLAPIAERRDLDPRAESREHVVFEGVERPIRRRDDAEVRRAHARLTEALVLAVAIEHAQQTRLQLFSGAARSGPIDIVLLLGWITHVELSWQHPTLANFLRRLAHIGRVIIMDKRGTRLSDRAFEAASLQDRVDDIRAVLEHAGVSRAVFFGVSEGASMAALFGAMHPNSTRGLILYGGTARMLAAEGYPHGLPKEFVGAVSQEMRAHWGEPLFVELEAPSMKDDEGFRDWLALFMRMAASPGNAVKMLEFNAAIDIRGALPHVSVPTLVLHRKGDQLAPFGGGAYMAEHIPGAQLVALEGNDHVPFVGDVESVHRAIESFARELRPETSTPPMRVVLFAATRDGAPNAALERVVAPIAARHRGEHIDTPKGVAIAFDGAPRAARAAIAISAAARGAGLAMGVALDAGVVTLQFLDRLHARAADVELSLPTATSLVRELAVGSNVGFVPIEGGLFAIEP